VNRNGYRFTCILYDTRPECGWKLLKGEKKEIRIQNVVASAAFNHPVDLDAVVTAFPHVEYRPEVFPGLPFRLKKPKTCILIFNSGRMVCTGAKSEREAKRAILKVARELEKGGIIIPGKPEIKIQNVVASGSLGGPVDLEALCERVHRVGESVMYEPEQFPGLIYRMESPRVVFLIYSNGKVVCVGAKKEEEIYEAMENLRVTLEEMEVLYEEMP
jgi:transcription initiation factor TFIID TATA-box-binding protein